MKLLNIWETVLYVYLCILNYFYSSPEQYNPSVATREDIEHANSFRRSPLLSLTFIIFQMTGAWHGIFQWIFKLQSYEVHACPFTGNAQRRAPAQTKPT